MIGFEHYVSGGQIGHALASNAEELGHALSAMIEAAPEDLGSDVAIFFSEADCVAMVDFLRRLAEKIEEAAA